MPVHDVPDESRPETWVWMFSYTWRDDSGKDIKDPEEIRKMWDKWNPLLGEPFKSAFTSAREHVTLWCDRVGQWPTVAWDNRKGRVTLAGDAAHPMTYRMTSFASSNRADDDVLTATSDRGQGLNNAIHDAAYLGRALQGVCHNGKTISEAIDAYDKEVVERGHEAVISSGENSMMLVDWDKLKESPMFKYGLQQGRK